MTIAITHLYDEVKNMCEATNARSHSKLPANLLLDGSHHGVIVGGVVAYDAKHLTKNLSTKKIEQCTTHLLLYSEFFQALHDRVAKDLASVSLHDPE